MIRVSLIAGVAGRRIAWLRPADGFAEAAAAGGALALLQRLLVAAEGAVGPEVVEDLPLADRDRLLAVIYRQTFGDRLEADATCTGCGAGYTMAFSLSALEQTISGDPADMQGPDETGAFRIGELQFRLPTSRDLSAVGTSGDAAAALLARCSPDGVGDAGDLAAAIEAVGPMLDTELDATCPECGAGQRPRFRIDRFLCGALERERPLRLREIHCIATAYGWSLDAILSLARSDRQGLVRLICERPGRTTPLDQFAAPARARA